MATAPFRIDIVDDVTVRVIAADRRTLTQFHEQLQADGLNSTLGNGDLEVEGYWGDVFTSLVKCER